MMIKNFSLLRNLAVWIFVLAMIFCPMFSARSWRHYDRHDCHGYRSDQRSWERRHESNFFVKMSRISNTLNRSIGYRGCFYDYHRPVIYDRYRIDTYNPVADVCQKSNFIIVINNKQVNLAPSLEKPVKADSPASGTSIYQSPPSKVVTPSTSTKTNINIY